MFIMRAETICINDNFIEKENKNEERWSQNDTYNTIVSHFLYYSSNGILLKQCDVRKVFEFTMCIALSIE